MKNIDAEDLLALQTKCKADFYFFSRYMFYERKNFKWMHNWHHRFICDKLMAVFCGEITRLIINIPPRYSKTELVVVNFVAWCMGQVPDCEFIYTTYSADLAHNYNAQARDLIKTEAYQRIFPKVKVSVDKDAKGHWGTTDGGVCYSAGVGGTMTGYGAGKMREQFGGAILLDDPHKASEARSKKRRENVHNWFAETLKTRLNDPKRTPMIIIMQRLHEDDLTGWLLAGNDDDEWEHVKLPALQPDGTALWEAKHNVQQLKAMEKAKPYMFAGQMQQEPTPGDGGVFKPSNIEIIDAVPQGNIKWVRGWDLGATVGGDPTAGVKLGKLPDGRLVIADIVHGDVSSDDRDRMMKNTASQDGKGVLISIPQDPGQAGKTQVQYLVKLLQGYKVHTSTETGDKVTRAEPIASQVNVGNVVMVRGAWNDAFLDEMRMFPNGAHDDRIDGLSRAYSQLIDSIFSYDNV
nr:phage terminase large subunit [Moraxella sp. CTOTU48268]